MATQTQLRIASPACEHERAWQAFFQQQGRRIAVLCQWMTGDAEEARALATWVWTASGEGPSPEVPPTNTTLLRALAAHFRPLFRHADPEENGTAQEPARVHRMSRAGKNGAALTLLLPQTPVKSALRGLRPEHRLVYLLHDLEGTPAATIAGWLEIDTTACAAMIHQARLAMRSSLGYA